jgi:hypothetical protein
MELLFRHMEAEMQVKYLNVESFSVDKTLYIFGT